MISSSAPQAGLSAILGVPAIAVARTGVEWTGLQTYQARSRWTSPTVRYATLSEAPTQ